MFILKETTLKDNFTIVQPLPPLLQHFLRIVQATVVSLLECNGWILIKVWFSNYSHLGH